MKVLAAVLVAAGLAWGGVALVRDDDHRVDPGTPEATRAIEAALEVVPGRALGVFRDADNGKWEVTVAARDGREYEVELDPATFRLLRLDYD